MQTLETIKSRGQETLNNLMEKGKKQPDEVKALGVTAGGAVVGAVTVAAVAKGVVAILATLASPPVALTVGAVGGGFLGWNWVKEQSQNAADEEATAPTEPAVAEPVSAMPAAEAAAA
ncbi:MAG: hypothetical protein KDE58_01935 [Caldilineaceae bacterium]|nr:hypothetical protein [Caldilineaceae bacterium]